MSTHDELLLLSGGMDSIALAFARRPRWALTVDYGHVSATGEIRAAEAVSATLAIRHAVVRVDCRALGSGALAGTAPSALAPVPEWWPFRNQLLVTVAAMHAIGIGAQRLILGTVASDRAHADGRDDFVRVLHALLQLQEGALSLEAPSLALSTVELIRSVNVPRELLAWAHSCHTGSFACGTCRGCQKHLNVTEALWGTEAAY